MPPNTNDIQDWATRNGFHYEPEAIYAFAAMKRRLPLLRWEMIRWVKSILANPIFKDWPEMAPCLPYAYIISHRKLPTNAEAYSEWLSEVGYVPANKSVKMHEVDIDKSFERSALRELLTKPRPPTPEERAERLLLEHYSEMRAVGDTALRLIAAEIQDAIDADRAQRSGF